MVRIFCVMKNSQTFIINHRQNYEKKQPMIVLHFDQTNTFVCAISIFYSEHICSVKFRNIDLNI